MCEHLPHAQTVELITYPVISPQELRIRAFELVNRLKRSGCIDRSTAREWKRNIDEDLAHRQQAKK